jgi:hypothetical protein
MPSSAFIEENISLPRAQKLPVFSANEVKRLMKEKTL